MQIHFENLDGGQFNWIAYTASFGYFWPPLPPWSFKVSHLFEPSLA